MNTPRRLTISQELTIYHAMDLKEQFIEALADADALELDLSRVAEIDTSGLQLLLLTKREAGRQGKQLTIVAHSPAVRQTLDFCNLASFFGDPVIITAHEQA
ncbi:lipid asymmetry maintenance protein MlaB [Dechloromonas denitrificans]|jgi:anti-anti-sigma factor|uniref:STAS domain-containing protein n=1 Tax=Dechloromonas denitrificans TaxID=281362 RepID=UPI001CF8BC72|nr:STAS domain-containing protein [Dechloromonas denitrificans]UCV04188.1 STAS domain-containing protein [Dechloromonas denitrificans]UCV08459.1 STAS domain-containing protein [Dechloromonas denitrificans]